MSDEKPPKSGKPKGTVVDFSTRTVTAGTVAGGETLNATSEAIVEYLESLLNVAKQGHLTALAVTGLTSSGSSLIPASISKDQMHNYKLTSLLGAFYHEMEAHCGEVIAEELSIYEE